MKQYFIKNEEKVTLFCFILLCVCILSAFAFCGFSKAFDEKAANIFSFCLAVIMCFYIFFPFVILSFSSEK